MLKEGWYLRAGNARTEASWQEHLNCLCIMLQALAVGSPFALLPLQLLLVCSGGKLLLSPPHRHHSCYLPHPSCLRGLWALTQETATTCWPPRRRFPPGQAPCPAAPPDKMIHSSPRQGKGGGRGKWLVFPTAQRSVVHLLPSFLLPHGQWPLAASNRKAFV